MSAAVITGAAGDLGRALTEAFVAEGYRVFGGDLLPCAPRAGLTPVQLDVTDRAAVFALAERAADPGRSGSGSMPPASSAWSRSTRPIPRIGSGSSPST